MPKNSIIVIGVRQSKKEMRITSKPGFYDAVHLSSNQQPAEKDSSYHNIPLDYKTKISIYFHDYNIQCTYQQKSLLLFEDTQRLTEEEVYKLSNHLAIKEGNRITFLSIRPNNRVKKHNKRIKTMSPESKLAEVE